MAVDHSHTQTFAGKMFGGNEGQGNQVTQSDDGDIRTLPDHYRLANLEGKIRGVEHRNRITRKAEVHRPIVRHRGPDGHLGRDRIGGGNHGRVGQGADDAQVLLPLVGHAVRPRCDPAVAGSDLDVQTRIVNAVAHLVQGPHAGKNGIGRGKGNQAGRCHAGGGGHHVLLGNAEIERPFREFDPELPGLDRLGNIGVEDDHVRILFADLENGLGVGVARRLFLYTLVRIVQGQPVHNLGTDIAVG